VKKAAQLQFSPTQHEREIASLRELSARVGSDPLLVQANNGNTSIKLDGILWIKASGKCLARASQEELLVPVELAQARWAVTHGTGIAQSHVSKNEIRPSIETAMHALLPHRVVIHVHSINTIAWAIRLDGSDQLKARLDGLHWQWIPYAASGMPLAREIEKAVARAQKTNVFILGNHGLVVCGDDCVTAEQLLCEVERRLAISPRPFPKSDTTVLGMIARFSGWQFPDFDPLHALGTDEVSLRILKGGVLYPCQAIFLGQRMPLLPPTLAASKFRERLGGQESTPPFVVVERSGVMLNENMTSAQRATLIGLAQVTQRTEEFARLRHLNRAEVEKVLNEVAHGYKDEVETEEKANSSAEIGKLGEERKAGYNRNTCFS
jgi:rhamnose utilization protein RhaD (predicted bifunctional aldolase and dehydrogenase)